MPGNHFIVESLAVIIALVTDGILAALVLHHKFVNVSMQTLLIYDLVTYSYKPNHT